MSEKPTTGMKRRNEDAAGPSGLKQEKDLLFEPSDDSFEDVSSDGEMYEEENIFSDEVKYEAPDEVPDNIWSDPPLINRQQLTFAERQGLKQLPEGNKPTDYFNLLVTNELYDLIVEETNAYAEQLFLSTDAENARIKNWKPLTREELRVFLGLFLHTGTIAINRLQDYWKKHWLFNLGVFSEHMGRNRFLLILRCLHFARNAGPGEDVPLDKLYKVRPILDYFNKKMLEVYSPQRELTLDESMISCMGRLAFRQHLPDINHRYGTRTYILAEPSGLTLKMFVFAGDVTSTKHASTVVLELMHDHFDKGHSLYMDNFYNSYSLASTLLQRKTYCTGTLKTNLKDNCPQVVAAKLKKGEVIEKCDERAGIMMAKWCDEHVMKMIISTEYTAQLVGVRNRRGEEKLKPEALIAYNKYKSGVDRRDQMLAYNACDRRTVRWYKKLGLNTLQVLLLNAWYLCNEYSGVRTSFYDFRLVVIEDLVGGTSKVPKPKLSDRVHLPSRLPSSAKRKVQRKDCRQCRSNKIRKQTNFCCNLCPEKPGLCLEPCFRLYHKY